MPGFGAAIYAMENITRKLLVYAMLCFAALSLTRGAANAQLPAPVGHRQPTAESVPADDSVLGSGATEHRSAAKPSANPKAANPMDAGLSFPNICSNCDQ